MQLEKKGELTDIMILMIVLFVFAIGFVVIMLIIHPITAGLKTAGLNNSAQGADAIDKLDGFNDTIDNGFMFLFFGLVASTLITSFLVRTHPIFLFLYIIFLGITLFVGIYLGNAYYDHIQNSPAFADIIDEATKINWVMNHIVEISLITGALSMIIVFAKFSTFGGTQQF